MIKCTKPYASCQHYSVVNGEHICCNINPGCPYGVDEKYDEIPNEDTLAAIEEMENGGGYLVDSVKDLFDELAKD